MKSDEPKDGGQAFPLLVADSVIEGQYQRGMSLRDYFAAKAMQVLIGVTWVEKDSFQDIAWMAYQSADAMLKRRNEQNE